MIQRSVLNSYVPLSYYLGPERLRFRPCVHAGADNSRSSLPGVAGHAVALSFFSHLRESAWFPESFKQPSSHSFNGTFVYQNSEAAILRNLRESISIHAEQCTPACKGLQIHQSPWLVGGRHGVEN